MSFSDLITTDLAGLLAGSGAAVVTPALDLNDNALLSWVNHIDASPTILTASQEITGLSISNVASPIVGRRWRFVSTSGYGQADFGSDVEIGVVVLVFPRDTVFPTTGTIRHLFDADGGTAGSGVELDSGALDIGTVEGYGYHVYILETPIQARYWRFTIAVSGVTFVDVGRAWAGPAWQPALNISYGYGDEWGDLSRISSSPRSGAEFPDEGPRQRFFSFGLNNMSASDAADIREMSRICGISKQLVFVKDPNNPGMETVLARMTQTTPILHPGLPIKSKAFSLRESL